MPFTLNGFGTIYYGNREKSDDGSFVTTVWVVLLFFPVIPLGSYRIRPLDNAKGFSFVGVPGRYTVQKTAINLKQVVNVYALFYGSIIFLVGLAAVWISR